MRHRPMRNSQMHHQSGFTLVELLVATGLLSVLLLAFTSYIFYQNRSAKFNQNRESMQSLQTNVIDMAGQEDTLIKAERLSP